MCVQRCQTCSLPNHGDKYNKYTGELHKEKVLELLGGLKKQQSIFAQARRVNDTAVKASLAKLHSHPNLTPRVSL